MSKSVTTGRGGGGGEDFMDYLWCECMTTMLSLLVCCSMYSYCNKKLNVDHFFVTKKMQCFFKHDIHFTRNV